MKKRTKKKTNRWEKTSIVISVVVFIVVLINYFYNQEAIQQAQQAQDQIMQNFKTLVNYANACAWAMGCDLTPDYGTLSIQTDCNQTALRQCIIQLMFVPPNTNAF